MCGPTSMNANNSTLGGDPISGKSKSLYVRYQNAAGHFSITVSEGSSLRIRDPLAQRLQMDFSQWTSTKFSAANRMTWQCRGSLPIPTITASPNLLQYALNLDPNSTGGTGLPKAQPMSLACESYLSLSHTTNPSVMNLSYVAEVSGDLHTWFSGDTYTQQQSPVGTNPLW